MTTPKRTLPRDLNGKVFGRWTAIRFVCNKWHLQHWECLCQCGNTKLVSRASLIKGVSRSCGCLNRELASSRAYKHGCGDKSSRTYRSWTNMRSRCANPNTIGWKNYGGRGIHFCSEWDDFAIFLRDMGECPPGRSLERIDVNGGYSAANCTWETPLVQSQNRRKTTHCKHGHVREGNTGIAPNGHRYCVPCARNNTRKHKARMKQLKESTNAQ